MTPETETDLPAAGINDKDGSEVKITRAYDTMIKSNVSNRVQGNVRGGHTRRGGHQGRVVQFRRFNFPEYISLIRNVKAEVEDFGAFLGTTFKQRDAKDKYKKFSEKLKQHILR